MTSCSKVLPKSTLDGLRGAMLTEEQARAIYAQGEEAVVFVLLELTKQLAEQKARTAAESHQTPATPSGMKPPYQKPSAKSRKRRPGAKRGHPGARRTLPDRVDWEVEHRAKRGSVRLVRTDSARSPRFGRFAWRGGGLACGRQNELAVVFWQCHAYPEKIAMEIAASTASTAWPSR